MSRVDARKKYNDGHKQEIKEYMRSYARRPEVKARHARYYLEHREEMLRNSKINNSYGKYKRKPLDKKKHREVSRRHAERKRLGIVVGREAKGYFWNAGKLWNGYFNYKKEAIKDAEEAFCIGEENE